MTYQLSRNGQLYGPYTLDDLRRYLASGNVLLTDLVKSDSPTDPPADWLPVSQLLSAEPLPPQTPIQPEAPAANPIPGEASTPWTAPPNQPSQSTAPWGSQQSYAAPAAPAYAAPYNPALASSPYPDPPNLHWALVLLFALLSCGLFMTVWNLIVAAWLRRVQPNAMALFYYIAAAILIFTLWITPGLSIHNAFLPGIPSMRHGHGWFSGLLLGVHWILKLIARFSEQASLEEHFNGPEPVGLTLNPVMTFFFGGLYFQYHLTRINTLKQAARFGQPIPYAY